MNDDFYIFLMVSSFVLCFIVLVIKWRITWNYFKKFKNKFQCFPSFIGWYGHLLSITDFGKGLDIIAESFIMTFYLPLKKPNIPKSSVYKRNRIMQFSLLFLALLLFCNFLISFFLLLS